MEHFIKDIFISDIYATTDDDNYKRKIVLEELNHSNKLIYIRYNWK